MKVYVDADACPVVDITVRLCSEFSIGCILACDTAHQLHREGAQTLIFDQGADSVDLAIANRVQPGDLVITQDYGLASLCLARHAAVLHQDGWAYTENNMDALMFQRHAAKKARMAGGRLKGPAKRRPAQDKAFQEALFNILSRDNSREAPI